MDAAELKIEKGSIVTLTDYPGSNLVDWDYGTVLKINQDQDEVLIEAYNYSTGRMSRFWEFVSNIKLK